MGGSVTRVDGWPVAPGTADLFTGRLKPAFERAFPGVTLHVYSGYRSYEDQVAIFTDRYRRSEHSPFGDYRWWDGSLWGRVSGEGTVAAPGTSNHQSGHALDIRDSGADAGVTVANNARSNWIRANAAAYGFSPAGYGFGEPWHIESTLGDPWVAISGGAQVAAVDEEEDDMPLTNDDIVKVAEKTREYVLAADLGGQSLKNRIRMTHEDVKFIKPRLLKARDAALTLVKELTTSISAKGLGIAGDTSNGRLVKRIGWIDKRARDAEIHDEDTAAALAGLTGAIRLIAEKQGVDVTAFLGENPQG
ncbi:D-alanyl-D-alanine carboxypeptidase family protein [Microbacterium sp. ZXX196]|uniref:M15 family metallopeptidase n=1 Tax=Microbacterium sp. ZXX196 TaxID=2609291 RepID=UPI0012B79B49|nr:M15 family metallopeptidase [Microbacterium sp. ZXX196]MTE24820.1 hypothetical protein [Microbacterium sp. ZXX196]